HIAEPFFGRADPSPPRFCSCSHPNGRRYTVRATWRDTAPVNDGARESGRDCTAAGTGSPTTPGAAVRVSRAHGSTRSTCPGAPGASPRPRTRGTIMAPPLRRDSGRRGGSIMDTAVALVGAYLRFNGYISLPEQPILVGQGRPWRYHTATDLDILAVRFPHAAVIVPRDGGGPP